MEALANWLNIIAFLTIFLASQFFWIRRVFEFGRRFISLRAWHIVLTAFMGALYALPIAFLFVPLTTPLFRAEHPRGARSRVALRPRA